MRVLRYSIVPALLGLLAIPQADARGGGGGGGGGFGGGFRAGGLSAFTAGRLGLPYGPATARSSDVQVSSRHQSLAPFAARGFPRQFARNNRNGFAFQSGFPFQNGFPAWGGGWGWPGGDWWPDGSGRSPRQEAYAVLRHRQLVQLLA
jgi:hypothetical protein